MTPKQFWKLLKDNNKQINTIIQLIILIIAILAYLKVQAINIDLDQVKGRLADFDKVIAGNISLKSGNETITAMSTNGSHICMPSC